LIHVTEAAAALEAFTPSLIATALQLPLIIGAVLFGTVLFDTALFGTVLFDTALFGTVLLLTLVGGGEDVSHSPVCGLVICPTGQGSGNVISHSPVCGLVICPTGQGSAPSGGSGNVLSGGLSLASGTFSSVVLGLSSLSSVGDSVVAYKLITGVDTEANTPDKDRDRIRINVIKLHFITQKQSQNYLNYLLRTNMRLYDYLGSIL
jgi:hypothetical protein